MTRRDSETKMEDYINKLNTGCIGWFLLEVNFVGEFRFVWST